MSSPSAPSSIDEPVELSRLLERESLQDLLRQFAGLHRVAVRVADNGGRILASATPLGGEGWEGKAHSEIASLAGEPLARVDIELQADASREFSQRLGRHLASVLGIVARAAYARHLTTAVHVATISHELRTPLTSIIGYAEMLIEGLAGEVSGEQRDFLRTILEKADQLLQLITGIIDVSLIESGALKIKKQPVSLVDVLSGVAAHLSPEATRRHITIEMPEAEVPCALVDRRKIRQVFLHLVANAIKFSPPGGDVAVDISVGPLGRGNRSPPVGLQVRVRDCGIGIPEREQNRIFEPFFQVDSSSTREYGGTGLGLSLAKSYVEAHGGCIWVESAPGTGSVFTVTLPAVPEELERHAARGGG